MADPELEGDFQEYERRLAARDLAEIRSRRRKVLLVLAAFVGGTALVIFGVRALLHDSPCVEMLDELPRDAKKGTSLRDQSQPSMCWAALTRDEGPPAIRVFASSDRLYEVAVAELKFRKFIEIDPLGLGDDAVLAIGAERRAGYPRSKPEEGVPIWMARETRFSSEVPDVHVAVISKGEAMVTVELDAATFTPEQAEKLVMAMRPKLQELRRLRPR